MRRRRSREAPITLVTITTHVFDGTPVEFVERRTSASPEERQSFLNELIRRCGVRIRRDEEKFKRRLFRGF